MIISVASGKGGTGKTTVAVGLTLSVGNLQLLDCDVDAADLHLLLNPKIKEAHIFKSGLTAVIDRNKYTQ